MEEIIPNGKKTVSLTTGVGKTGPLSYTTHKNKCKMDERPNAKSEIIKILEENTGSNFFDIGYRNFFLHISSEARETKAKINC